MYDNITHIVIDIDGTMTDGGIYYDTQGNEFKKFNTRDAVAFWAAQAVGIEMIVITGRKSRAVEQRMHDLGVRLFYQGVSDKKTKIMELMESLGFTSNNLGYIGDDLNDIPGMQCASFIGCPDDACEEVKCISSYISPFNGGNGAVRDAVSYLIKKQGKWDIALKSILVKYGM